jgi:uncharacterized membrane protein YecN with MAPEG domain
MFILDINGKKLFERTVFLMSVRLFMNAISHAYSLHHSSFTHLILKNFLIYMVLLFPKVFFL